MLVRTHASFWLSLALVLAMVLAGPARPAAAHGLVDQEFTAGAADSFERFAGPFTAAAGVNATDGAAQSFTVQPDSTFALGGLVAVAAFLVPNGGVAPRDIPLTARLRADTRLGPVLATAAYTVPQGSVGTVAAPFRAVFRFPAPVAVTPGSVYFFQIDPDGGLLGWATAPNRYFRGQFCQGASCGPTDAGFIAFAPFTMMVGINATGGAAQGFTPTQSNLVGADALLARGFARATPTTLTAHIIAGTRFGAVLGTARVTIPAGGTFGFTPIHFDFSPAVPLTPGQPYFFQIDPEGGIFGWAGSFGDPYAGGSAFQGGSALSATDFGFGTYYAIDVEPPVVTCAQPDAAWHATDQSFACTATDAGIGLANPADASFTLTTSVPAGTETATAQTGSREVCDGVGNCAQAGPLGPVLVDKKPPQVTVSSPSGTFVVGGAGAAAAYSCADGGSGVATCTGPAPSGAAVDTSTAGSFTFTVSGTDAVGNAGSASVAYTVTYAICSPDEDDDGESRTPTGRRQIQLRLALCDASGANVSAASVTVAALEITDGTLTYPARSARKHDASTAFRFKSGDEDDEDEDDRDDDDEDDRDGGHYSFTLDVRGLPAGPYLLRVAVSGDPLTHDIAIIVR